jgi:predicted RNase H-like HicB family nuclease
MPPRHHIGIAEPDGSGWSLGFPAFPGTVTTGDTLAELIGHARDALASVVATMEEDGLTLPASVDADPQASPCAPMALVASRSVLRIPRLSPGL